MNKCQHAEKITHFCISEHCQARQGGACEQCLRKYHLHPPLLLLQDDLHALIKKFTMESSVKPKCRLLQQSIFNYFNQIKTQLGNSLDTACKNIINQIGYPFLYSQGILSTFKRLKSKEYRRLPQKDIRAFAEIAAKIGEKDLAREESSIYSVEVRDIHEVILQLEALLKSYELLIKRYHSAPIHQGYYTQKLMEVFKGILTESPGRNVKNLYELDSRGKTKEQKVNLSTSYNNNTKLDMKTFEAKAIQLKNKAERIQKELEPMIASPNVLGLPKTQKIRDVSLDRKINKEVKSTPRESQLLQKPNGPHVAQIKTPVQNLQHVKLQLTNRQLGLNHKKKLLMDIMKTNEKTDRQAFEKFQSIELTLLSKLDDSSHPRKERFSTDTKSVNGSQKSRSSEDLTGFDDHIKTQEDQKIYAFSKLALEESCKKPVEKQEVKKKLIVIPTEFNSKDCNKGNQMDSPLFKKHRIQNNFEQIKLKEIISEKDSPKKLQIQPKQVKQVKQVLQLKQNEQKSLALLLKSLSMNAQQAIEYLQSSLKYADNNLSAAQYLSYLYLELNRPKDCLILCNRYLDRMQHSRQSQELAVNLSNNKAAALNILGRYSEAIMIIQQCLKYKEKDTLYKNLGDSYFSIGIYDKAIGNYQKSIKLNPNNEECYYNLAASLFIQQNYQASRSALKKALQANPKNESYLQLQSHIQSKGKSI